MRGRSLEFFVGLFLMAGIISLILLAFKVSGLTSYFIKDNYYVSANFTNIGGLKVRSQVTLAGVRVGEVAFITLDPETFQAKVTLRFDSKSDFIPEDTIASIMTEGLLGANYVSLTPGFSEENLQDGGQIEETNPAILLENLIGQFIFNAGQKESKK